MPRCTAPFHGTQSPSTRAAAAAFVLLSLLGGAVAHAQGAPPDPGRIQAAAESFDEGARAFKAKEYDAAALAFEAADRAAPSPAALANAIRARKLGKQAARAATIAAAAVARYPKDKELVELAEPLLRAADRQLHRVTVSCKPDCSLVIDGKVATSDRVGLFVAYLDPGTHSVIGGWTSDRSKTASVKATAGGIESLDLVAPDLPKASGAAEPSPALPAGSGGVAESPAPVESAPSAPPPKAASGLPPWVVFLGGGATVVLGGVATWSGIDTRQNPGPDAVRSACAGGPDSCALYQQGLRKERRTNLLFGATAGAAVATGIVALFLTDWSSGKTAAGATRRWTPLAAVGAVGASQRGNVSIGMEGVF